MVLKPTIFENKIFKDPRGLLVDLSAQVSRFNFETVHQCFSLSESKNTLRGLHFQSGKYAQSKIVSCVTGSLIDIVVNIDRSAEDFGKVFYFSLNGLDGNSVYVPIIARMGSSPHRPTLSSIIRLIIFSGQVLR